MYQRIKTKEAAANQSRAMETGDHSKNGASPKSQMSRFFLEKSMKNFKSKEIMRTITAILISFMLFSCNNPIDDESGDYDEYIYICPDGSGDYRFYIKDQLKKIVITFEGKKYEMSHTKPTVRILVPFYSTRTGEKRNFESEFYFESDPKQNSLRIDSDFVNKADSEWWDFEADEYWEINIKECSTIRIYY